MQQAGSVGLPDTNSNGYAEYRSTYLTISSAIVEIVSAQLCRVSTESANAVITSQHRGTVDVKVNHSSAQVHALAGTVNICPSEADTGQCSVARCNAGASLLIGAGVTVATVLAAGRTTIRGSVTTLTVEGEQTRHQGTITTVNVNSGELSYESTATITTVNLAGGVFECRNDVRAKTITNFNLSGGMLSNPFRTITFSNGIAPAADLVQAS